MASYLNREISEWNTSDLSKWLLDNKYPGISELCQNNSLSGYDLFYITEDTLKNEFGLNSFHERQVTMKLIKKLIYEHLRLNIINSNGDNVILTLDNNPNTCLGDLNEYIGSMFNIKPNDILYKDTTKTEVLSPSIKIAELMILYPRLYKTLHIFNMKDYRQSSNENENNIELNENLESKENDLILNNTNNNNIKGNTLPINNNNSLNDSELIKSNKIQEPNSKRNIKMNFDYKMDRNDMNANNNINNNSKRVIYSEDYEIRNKEEKRYKNNINNNNTPNEDSEENYNQMNWDNKAKYKMRGNYDENEEYIRNKEYISFRNRKNNFIDKPYQDNYNKQYKNFDKKENYYDN